MPTLLAKRAGVETPIATDDDHHEQMASDPSINQFPQGSSFGQSTGDTNGFGQSTNSPSGGSSAFGSAQAGGFGASSSFGSASAGGFGAMSGSAGANNMPQQPSMNLTQAGDNAATGAEVLVANDNTDWINKKWRPAMGWMYMVCCMTDFVLFPILWSLLQALSKGQVTSQWQPVTLMGAGLFHVSMGAIIGVTAYGRTKEKLAEKS
jgi:hypothetical protein